jgi:hypothetical protein
MSPPPQSNNLPPESPEYLDKLSVDQRSKLLEFIDRFGQTYGDGDFDPGADYSDPGLVALALRCSQMTGVGNQELEQFFEQEFGLVGITGGDLGTMLALARLLDAENLVTHSAGGRS